MHKNHRNIFVRAQDKKNSATDHGFLSVDLHFMFVWLSNDCLPNGGKPHLHTLKPPNFKEPLKACNLS